MGVQYRSTSPPSVRVDRAGEDTIQDTFVARLLNLGQIDNKHAHSLHPSAFLTTVYDYVCVDEIYSNLPHLIDFVVY